MNKILFLDSRYVIVGIVSQFTYVKIQDGKYVPSTEDQAVGKYVERENTVYPNDLKAVEVSQVPEEIVPGKYCYTDEIGFYINTDWKEPPKDISQITNDIDALNMHQAEIELDIDYRLSLLELGNKEANA
ncbi:hypothetical protein [Anaeromicropila populeti]|uniref:Uncharacterized protein n=1 Tax=Anaeromicropila populeti TaxID=37658 RepID=A0A1I6JIH3_9FIRM|nr:hypothetical protein [Anaeromicropila populeti]SFR78694.1 hypothetical protein SAMN05661086_01714 [Anaeromicropila populeti]